MFQCLTSWICSTLLNTTLTYYDRTQPVIIQTNSRQYGLGATLIQNGHPITFASKMFTNVRTGYAHTKMECLSVCFNLESSTLTPLAGITPSKMTTNPWKWSSTNPFMLHPSSSMHATPSAKVQCTSEHKPSREMILAYYLSWLPSYKEHLPIVPHQSIQHIPFSTERLNIIWGAVEWDTIHNTP